MSSQPAYWRLDGRDTTLLVIQDHEVPRLYWHGQSLGPVTDLELLQVHDDLALAHGTLDAVTPLSLFPQASTGYPGSAALSGHRDGAAFAHALRTRSVRQQDNRLLIELVDEHAGLMVELVLSLDADSDVASLQSKLHNIADSPYTVDWLASATVPLPGNYRQCLSQHGRWGLENQTQRRPIAAGRIDISNLHGRTSHEHAPALICGTENFAADSGDVLFAQLAWSGNFSLRVERLSNGTVSLQAGVLFLPGECILQAGESISTPAVTFTRSQGMNSATQRFHRHMRSHILPAWTRKPRPIHANSWEALYFNHDQQALFSLIDAAASIGAERFVLDDGWFRHRRADDAGLGDWFVDEQIYPDGLHPVVERVRQHGLQFGLWFEPEMVNPDSDLYRQHPDWALHLAQVQTPLARNQLVLDIARDDVADYLYERITCLVQEYAIDYIKWDMNRDLVLAGDGTHARSAAQPVALYRLLERILACCPGLEIETCASGGARADAGILKHTGRVWTSDNIDPIERSGIQQGFLRFMPPEIMGAHVGHDKAHLTGRMTSLHTRAIVALQGQFGFELDARVLDQAQRNALQHYTALYKQHRGWMASSAYWQIPTFCQALSASALVDEHQDRALVSVVATGNLQDSRPGRLPLCGLDPEATYSLSLASTNLDELAPFNRQFPTWCRETQMTRGDLLMNIGIPLPVLPPQSALLISCQREARA